MSQRRIVFGHQSVGRNLLDGLARLAQEQPAAGLRIILYGQRAMDGPGIAHVLIGENREPESKIAHFDRLMSGGLAEWADVAFFKLCYVDFDADTDPRQLFEAYHKAHEARMRKHPRITFAHVTTPLTTVERGSIGWLKRIAGSEPWGERENVKRNEYNDLLRAAYGQTEPLFDLARYQAAGEAGWFTRHGRRYECLASAHTSDGGHLNSTGQLAVATHLAAFLAALPA